MKISHHLLAEIHTKQKFALTAYVQNPLTVCFSGCFFKIMDREIIRVCNEECHHWKTKT